MKLEIFCEKEIYDKIKDAADAKIHVMKNDIWGELEARYEAHRTRGWP